MMKRILICDDDDMWLELNSHRLRTYGYEVVVTNTAVDILEQVGKAAPHLIVMDYQMPMVTGAEATLELKQHEHYKSIPVILYSSTDTIATVAEECGADAFLIKSLDEQLAMLAAEMIGSEGA
jgi:CheY-like chemotaxis protein